MNLNENNTQRTTKFITPIVFFLFISLSPLNAQDNSPDRWQKVERWVGTITYEYKGTDAPIGGMPGTASQTITYNVALNREDDRTWRGNAEGHGSTEAYAEQISDRSQHTISSSGQGSLEDQAYLTLNYRRGHYTIGITGRPGPITVQHQEKWTMVGETLKDIDETIETTLMRVSSGAPFRETPQLPESGMVLSGTLEFNFHWESHKLSWSLQPEGHAPLAQEEEDFNCISLSSLIFCQAQAVVLQEEIPGTPFQLVYRSDRNSRGCNENAWEAETQHLGGWTLSSHHFFDAEKNVLHLGNGARRNIPKENGLRPPFPGFLVASEDGAELYHFDENGKHLRTLHPLTGAALYTFHYSNDMLARIEDFDRYSVNIERTANGEPSTIRGPFGQITRLLLDQNGFVRTINKHGGESVRFVYNDKGLITSRWDARGNNSSYQYNDCGRLVRAIDAGGSSKTYERTDIANGYQITETTSSGKKSQYIVENQLAEGSRWVNIFPGGVENTMFFNSSDYRVANFHDGTKVEVFENPDSRFGMQAPCKTTIITYPDGTKHVTEIDRVAILSNPSNPLSLVTLTEMVTINGRTYIDVYDASSRTLIRTSPAGRQTVMMLDEIGRILSIHEPNQAPVVFKYDRGQLIETMQGSGQTARRVTMKYNREGWLESVTDPMMQVSRFEYDLAGRVKKVVLPDAGQTLFDYDESGNIDGITPPGKAKHSFEHTPLNLVNRYTPPPVQGTSHSTTNTFNTDRQLTSVNLGGQGNVSIGYDAAGRLGNIRFTPGSINYSYDRQGRLEKVTFPDGAIEHKYSGALNETEIWTGSVTGRVNYQYNNDFQLESIKVNNSQPIHFEYDDDGLVTQAGNLEIYRNTNSGFVEGTSLGRVSDIMSYDDFGEMDSYTATFEGQVLFETEYQRDDLGRITSLTERILGETKTRRFEYDSNGRLEREFENGLLIAHYQYDDNGNRISLTTPEGIISSSHDAQDRLIYSGDATYSYNNFGQLKDIRSNQETSNFQYDELGNLRKYAKPGVGTIENLADGHNRRIGTKINGNLVLGLIYLDQLNPLAQVDANGNLQSVFVYGTAQNVPNHIVKGGRTFRLITDHLGSIRLVVDIESGNVEQRIDFDAFGLVLEDTNPGFQPFGFAGGIYDNHTGFVRFGARDYDPQAGRWTAKDPILFDGGDTNLYAYVGNNPVNFVDPTGEIILGLCAVAIVAGAIYVATLPMQQAFKRRMERIDSAKTDQEAIDALIESGQQVGMASRATEAGLDAVSMTTYDGIGSKVLNSIREWWHNRRSN